MTSDSNVSSVTSTITPAGAFAVAAVVLGLVGIVIAALLAVRTPPHETARLSREQRSEGA